MWLRVWRGWQIALHANERGYGTLMLLGSAQHTQTYMHTSYGWFQNLLMWASVSLVNQPPIIAVLNVNRGAGLRN